MNQTVDELLLQNLLFLLSVLSGAGTLLVSHYFLQTLRSGSDIDPDLVYCCL